MSKVRVKVKFYDPRNRVYGKDNGIISSKSGTFSVLDLYVNESGEVVHFPEGEPSGIIIFDLEPHYYIDDKRIDELLLL